MNTDQKHKWCANYFTIEKISSTSSLDIIAARSSIFSALNE